MPYAEEVLALLPSLDVRLIEVKLPLANEKKLQQILPNVIEEFVLAGAQSLSTQVLPPVAGQPALLRTVALIERHWFTWLTKQLEGLISQRVRLIPACLLLELHSEVLENIADNATNIPSVAYQYNDQNIIFTHRTGKQLGISWVEKLLADGDPVAQLPGALKGVRSAEFSWDWVVVAAHQYVQDSKNIKSANFALNLLPKSFKKLSDKTRLANIATFLKRNRANNAPAGGVGWADLVLWRQPIQWFKYLLGGIVFGYVLHLMWLTVDNWRWENQMATLAAQSLTPASIAKLKLDQSSSVLGAFIRQSTEDQRRQGLVTDADFVPMAVKLHQLNLFFGPEVLQKLEYDGYSIDFELKPGVVDKTNTQILQKARTLGLMLEVLGPYQYRLQPYSGLGTN